MTELLSFITSIFLQLLSFITYIFLVTYAFVKMGFLWGAASIVFPLIPAVHIIVVYIIPYF